MVLNTANTNKTNNHLSSELAERKTKTMTYDVGNPGSGLEQVQKCGGVLLFTIFISSLQNISRFILCCVKIPLPT